MLSISVDFDSGVPLYLQLEEQIRLLLHQGVIQAGEPMPTVRELSVSLGVNANTVARVYRDLQREGLLILKRGKGTFVNEISKLPEPQKLQMKRITTTAKKLAELASEAGMTPVEVLQLLKQHWNK